MNKADYLELIERQLDIYKGVDYVSPPRVPHPTKPHSYYNNIEYVYYDLQADPGYALRAFIDKAFTQDQINLIVQSLNYIIGNFGPVNADNSIFGIWKAKVLAGDYQYPRDEEAPFPTNGGDTLRGPTEDKKWNETWKMNVTANFSMGSRGGSSPQLFRTIYIDRYDKSFPPGSTSFELGQATIQHYWLARFLKISLNGTYLNTTTPLPSGNSRKTWAGIIFHEIMHNLGWVHGSDQHGSYIQAMQDSFDTNTTGFTLTG
jgi:hypothetical protein